MLQERVSGAKLLQKAAGVQPVVLWASAAIFDWLWFLVISITIIISCIVYNVIGLSSAAELGKQRYYVYKSLNHYFIQRISFRITLFSVNLH